MVCPVCDEQMVQDEDVPELWHCEECGYDEERG